jgi:hypothetical protein
VFEPDVTASLNFTFLGETPFTLSFASPLKFVPSIVRLNFPAAARSQRQLWISGRFAVPVPPPLPGRHRKVTCIPCWFPRKFAGHPTVPAGNVVRFWLVPAGPLTNIKNVFPAFTEPKLNNASTRFAFNTWNRVAWITLFGFPLSTANTDVTFAVPFGSTKHAPDINRSCAVEQSPSDGVTDITTGALTPRSITHVVVLVNAPNRLLSPAVNVVVNVRFANPPQHVNGNAVPTKPGAAGPDNVPLTRFLFNGVTAVNGIVKSGTPSAFVSQITDSALVTVFPGRCSGTPVSALKPWHTVVVSLGINAHPTKFNCTLHTALMIPEVGVAICAPAEFRWLPAAAVPTAGCPGATATVPTGVTVKHCGLTGHTNP